MGFKAYKGLGLRDWGLGFRAYKGLGLRAYKGLGLRAYNGSGVLANFTRHSTSDEANHH